MSEWKEYTLEDLAEILNHKRIPLSSMQRSKRRGTFPYYGASGVIDFVDDYIFDGEHVLISEDGENLKSRQTPIAFIADGKFWVNNHAHIIKGKKEYFNRLIVYYFENLDLNPFLTGAVQPKLNKAALTSIPIYLPESESEQKAIVEVLSSLDDKIDLLHRQNKTLEQLAETLFRQWFVEEAEESWEVGTIEDVISVKGGTTPSTSNPDFWDGEIYWTSPRDLANNASIFLFNTERKITEKGLAQIGSGLLPIGTVLLSSRAPIGYLAITEIPLAINQGYIAIICDKSISNYFMFLWCKANMETIENAGNGSVFQEISKSSFKTLEFVKPPKDKLLKFDKTVEPIFQKIKSNQIQIRTLTQLRDALLPKLMSGEIRIDLEDSELTKPVKSKKANVG